jgi:murein DD-endopeptidase MepM/ murein hydrolase activator NlpD
LGGSGGLDKARGQLRRASLLAATGLVGFGLALAAVALASSVDAGPLDPSLAGVSAAPPADAKPEASSAPAQAEAMQTPSFQLDLNGRLTASGVIRPGGSLARALASQGVSASAIHTIVAEMRPVFDFRQSHAGDTWRVVHDADDQVVEFQYATSDMASYVLTRRGSGYVAERREPKLEHRTARVAGVVTSSLYDAIRDLGESPQLAGDFADLFAWDVDFSRSVQPGDRFAILYERLYRRPAGGEAQYVGPGMILAARYQGQAGIHSVVYFENGEARGGYYREDGSSVERQFLVAPVKYTRIASRFNPRRRHPILKVTRPHYGIDYAASTGTPIFAVADGQVVYRGWSSGYGKLVKVRHTNGFVSYYAHMSRFAGTVSSGDWVHQKQVIGYVGSTGLSTGPHVCFRIKNGAGRFVNPAKLRTPAGDPVPTTRQPEFGLVRDALFAQLDGSRLIATDEAL